MNSQHDTAMDVLGPGIGQQGHTCSRSNAATLQDESEREKPHVWYVAEELHAPMPPSMS